MKKFLFIFVMLLSLCVVLAGCEMGGPVAPTTYKITFDSDGGSNVAAIVAEAGAEIAAPTDPTKEGFVFAGWYLGEVKYEFSVMPDTNIELKAKWEEEKQPEPDPILYTIIFDVNGGDTLIEASITAPAGSALTLPLASKEGFNFLGWYNGEVKFEEVTMPEANITLVAKWEEIQTPEPDPVLYTLTLDVNGGNALAQTSIKAEAGAAIVLPTPTRDGYNFAGWLLDGALFNETVMPEADLTIVAKWEEIKAPTYKVTYILNGGNAIYPTYEDMVADFLKDVNAMTGKELTDATQIYNAGNVYHLLFNDDEMAEKWGWIPKLFLQLWQEGHGNYSELEAEYTAFINKNATAEMGEYKHHWGMRQNLQGLMTLTRCASFAGSGAIDFGKYEINSLVEGAILGGQYIIDVEEGKELNTAYRLGYMLEGWYSDESLTQKVTSVTANTILYAKWEKVYTKLNYDLNNENATLEQTVINVHVSDEITLSTPIYDATKWRFDGWYLDENFTEQVYVIPTRTNKDVTVYAQWTELTGYNITYNTNGGSLRYSSRQEMVDDFLTDALAWAGKTNKPNCMVDDLGVNVGFANVFTAICGFFQDARYTAKWTWLKDYIIAVSPDQKTNLEGKNEPTWRYSLGAFLFMEQRTSWPVSADFTKVELNNGFWDELALAENNVTLNNSGEVTLPTPYKPNYTFDGWYNNAEFTGNALTVVSSESVLYAKWKNEVASYKITYELNGATSYELDNVYPSDLVADFYLKTPVKEGYAFQGWYTTSTFDGGTEMKFIPAGRTGDIQLYAKWAENKLGSNKTVAIYGDSLSTYLGWVPSDATHYYPTYSATVKDVDKTWWKLLMNKAGTELHTNVSYSGSTVCGSATSCGVNETRISKLLVDGQAPDILIILLGVNDVVSGTPAADFKATYKDMLAGIRALCPDTDIFICNIHYETASDGSGDAPASYKHEGLREEYNVVISQIAQEESLPLIDLASVITKDTDAFGNKTYVGDNIHYNAAGMELVAATAYNVLKEFYK